MKERIPLMLTGVTSDGVWGLFAEPYLLAFVFFGEDKLGTVCLPFTVPLLLLWGGCQLPVGSKAGSGC